MKKNKLLAVVNFVTAVCALLNAGFDAREEDNEVLNVAAVMWVCVSILSVCLGVLNLLRKDENECEYCEQCENTEETAA